MCIEKEDDFIRLFAHGYPSCLVYQPCHVQVSQVVQRNEGQAAWGCGAQQKEEELTKVSLKNTAECRKALEWLLY